MEPVVLKSVRTKIRVLLLIVGSHDVGKSMARLNNPPEKLHPERDTIVLFLTANAEESQSTQI